MKVVSNLILRSLLSISPTDPLCSVIFLFLLLPGHETYSAWSPFFVCKVFFIPGSVTSFRLGASAWVHALKGFLLSGCLSPRDDIQGGRSRRRHAPYSELPATPLRFAT
uniref:Uncharacterized protein n=1 Tax=Anguilla anguilla TaxID=7936 RepID=A0A0E9X0T1_ANGAN